MTDDEMSDLIGGYKSYDYSTEGEDEVTVIDYEKKRNTEEENYTYVSTANGLSVNDFFLMIRICNQPKI